MNKQEAIELLKNIAKESVELTKIPVIHIDGIVEVVNQIDESKKITVPKDVANWYRIAVESGRNPLADFTDVILTMGKYDGINPRYNYDTGLYKWIKETSEAIQIVSNMHQFGYEIEEDNGVWKPKYDEDYYYIDDEGDVLEDCWTDSFKDDRRLSIGNVFQTLEEAEDEVERLKVLAELKSFACKFRYDEDNWLMFYDHEKLLEKIKLRNMFSGWKNDTKI